MNARTRKSQMEMMGMAVIVVLIILALFFIFSFRNSNTEDTSYQSLAKKEMASKFLTTYKQTAVECAGRKLTFEDLIFKCSHREELSCDPTRTPAPAPTVCEYLEEQTGIVVKSYFDISKESNYVFKIKDLDIVVRDDNEDTPECTDKSNGDEERITISLYKNNVQKSETVILKICK